MRALAFLFVVGFLSPVFAADGPISRPKGVSCCCVSSVTQGAVCQDANFCGNQTHYCAFSPCNSSCHGRMKLKSS